MTFAAPLFLLAVLAGAIPLALHMINRHRAPVMPFSTLRFLRISVQRTRRRKYLHDVFLLLLRIGALVLVAVGLAQPTLTRLGGIFGRSTSAVVLILDNSASMASADEGGTRWELAIKAAEQLVDQLADGDRIALLPTNGFAGPARERLYQNHEVVRQAVESCRVGAGKADLAARLDQARQLLAKDDSPNKEIYVITDMQSVSWESLKSGAAASERSGRSTPVVVVDVRRPALANVALKSLEVRSAGPVAGVPASLSVKLVGDAKTEQQRHLELIFDGKPAGSSPTLSVSAGETLEHVFRVVPDRPGVHRGEIRLVGEDASPLDNRLFFALTVDPAIPVAIVQRPSTDIGYLEDAYYLERALRPIVSEVWAIQVTKLTPDQLASEPLSNYAVVFCVNLPPPGEEAGRRLRDYVQAGGRVVWTCGTNVDPVLYSALDDSQQHELLPARMTVVREVSAERPDGWHVGWIDDKHPSLAALAEPASLYQSVHVTRHVIIAAQAGSDVRTLLRLDDGEPLLVQRSVGSGQVLMLGTSVHVDWSNLPLRPIFLPLIARLTFHLAGAEAAQPQLIAGVPLRIPIPSGSHPTLEIVRPNGDVVRMASVQADRGEYRYGDTDDPGVYEVRINDVARRQLRGYALNFDPAEIDSSTLAHEALATRFGEGVLVFADNPLDVASTVQSMRNGRNLAEPFLIVVLLALIVEAYVANRRVERPPTEEPLPQARPPMAVLMGSRAGV